MRFQKHFLIAFIFLSLWFSPWNAFAGLFDNDEENWRRMFGEIKKINARLVSLEMGKLKAMQSVQEDVLRQIEEIKSIIPDLRGTVEQNQSEMGAFIKQTNKKLSDIEAQLKFEIIENLNKQNKETRKFELGLLENLNKQNAATEKFEASLVDQFNQLRNNLAGDMEKFSQINQKYFQGFSQANSESIGKMAQQLNAQNQTLEKANEIFRTELIPAIVKQNEQSRNSLLAEVSKSNKKNHDALVAGFSESNAKNKKLVEILEKSLTEAQVTSGQVQALAGNIGQTNNNVVQTHDSLIKLKDILVKQLDTLSKGQANLGAEVVNGSKKVDLVQNNLIVADNKMNKLAESLKGIQTQNASANIALASLQQGMDEVRGTNSLNGEKLNKLISSSAELMKHANQVSQSLQNMDKALQTIEGGLANVDLANQKLSRLIQILKTIAAEQGKVTQVLAVQAEIKQSQGAILKMQNELRQSQGQMKQSLAGISQTQGKVLGSQGDIKQTQLEMRQAQIQMGQAQAEIKQNLAEVGGAQVEMRQAQIQMGQAQADLKQAQLQMKRAQVDMKRIQGEMNGSQNRVLKTQEDIKNTQREIIKAQTEIIKSQMETRRAQKETKKVLADLSRKANVNIARNDAIRKTLANMGKGRAPQKPARKR